VRRITDDNQLALACTSCRFAHYVTIGAVRFGPSASEEAETSTDAAPSPDAQARLAGCLEAHAAALSLREMDVFEDLAVLRCAECRRHYTVAITAFETHQK
jgi:ribosomal protein L33